LGFFIKNNNKTVYQWRTGVEPSQIVKQKETQYYDFGNDKPETNDEIDFNIDFGTGSINLETNQETEVYIL
jgi:hypothetical protein